MSELTLDAVATLPLHVLPGGAQVRGEVRDGSVAFILKDGTRVECERPNRVGREYGTPWLDHKLCREWNIDLVDSLTEWGEGRSYTHNPQFIVGKWGTGSDSDEGVIARIPFSEVAAIEPIEAPPCELGCTCRPGHGDACRVSAVKYATEAGLSPTTVRRATEEYLATLGTEDLVALLTKFLGDEVMLEIVKSI